MTASYRSGDHVKVEFTDEISGETEWVWIKVVHVEAESELLFGILDSQPVVNTTVRSGQQLAISFDKVRDHRRFPTQ